MNTISENMELVKGKPHSPETLKFTTPTGRLRRSFIPQLTQVVPYYPVLKKYGYTPTNDSNILMVQLEYWFDKMFDEGKWYWYKYVEPPKRGTKGYTTGDDWCAELEWTPKEFRDAFDEIGVAHLSKGNFDKRYNKEPRSVFFKTTTKSIPKKNKAGKITGWKKVTEKKEMLYASYHDRMRDKTYFFRNDEAIDRAMLTIATAEPGAVNLTKKVQARNEEKSASYSRVNSTSGSYSKLQNWNLHYQEITVQESTYNIVTHSDSTESVTTSNAVANTSLPSVNQENSTGSDGTDSTDFVPVGSGDGEAGTGSVKEARNNKIIAYLKEGFTLVDPQKNLVYRPLTKKDDYFFHAFEFFTGKQYQWPQDLTNSRVLAGLKELHQHDDEDYEMIVNLYFHEKFEYEKKVDYSVHHFLAVAKNFEERVRCPETVGDDRWMAAKNKEIPAHFDSPRQPNVYPG